MPWCDGLECGCDAGVEGCATCECGYNGAWDDWVQACGAGVDCYDGGWDDWVETWGLGVGCCNGGWDDWVEGWGVGVGCCDGAWGQCLLLWPSSLHIRHLLHNPTLLICVSSFLSSHSCNLLFFFGLPSNALFGGGKISG